MLLITKRNLSKNKNFLNNICKNKYATKNNKNEFRIVEKSKHFAPMTREWVNSVYSFDSNYLKQVSNNYNLTNKLIKGYFSLNSNLINSKRVFSRRLKSNFFRSSLNKILLSKPEIKLTNDKVNLTVYIFNNEKRVLMKKLFYYNVKKSLLFLKKVKKIIRKIRKIKLSLITSNINNKNLFVKTLKKNIRLKKTLNNFLKTLFLRKSRKNRKKNLFFKSNFFRKKYRRSIKIFKDTRYANQIKKFYSTNNSTKDYSLMHNLFYFKFLTYLCSLFEIKLNFKDLNSNDILFITNGKIQDTITMEIKDKIYSTNLSYLHENSFNSKMDEKEKINILYKNRNIFILQFLNNILNKSNLNGKHLINHFFKIFSNKYYFVFLKPQIQDNITYFRNYIKFLINKHKFGKLLPGLKKLITKVYNRKVEINLVNLKHPSLNSDIFMQCLAFFLKAKSKVFLLKLLHKFSSKLKIIPRNIKFINKDSNNLDYLTYYKSTKFNYPNLIESNLKSDKDFLQQVFDKIYLYSLNSLSLKSLKLDSIDNVNSNIKIKDNFKLAKLNKLTCFLNKVKYKYIVGMKIETAGRLSQRNTAERSRYSFKYIGHLRDLNYPKHYKWTKTSKSMLRNSLRSNNIYSSISSKRRIGSFGVKGWISGGL